MVWYCPILMYQYLGLEVYFFRERQWHSNMEGGRRSLVHSLLGSPSANLWRWFSRLSNRKSNWHLPGQSNNIWCILIPQNNLTCSSLDRFNVSVLFESDTWVPHIISVFKNRSNIATVHNTKFNQSTWESTTQPIVGLFQHIINLHVPFEAVFKIKA